VSRSVVEVRAPEPKPVVANAFIASVTRSAPVPSGRNKIRHADKPLGVTTGLVLAKPPVALLLFHGPDEGKPVPNSVFPRPGGALWLPWLPLGMPV
jgi:hypothetical protein